MPVRASQLRSVIALTPFCVFTFAMQISYWKTKANSNCIVLFPLPSSACRQKGLQTIETNRIESKPKQIEANQIESNWNWNWIAASCCCFWCASSDTWLGIKLRHWHGLNNVQWVHQFCVFNVNSGWVIEDWLTNSKNNKSKRQQQQQQEQNESNKMVMTTF